MPATAEPPNLDPTAIVLNVGLALGMAADHGQRTTIAVRSGWRHRQPQCGSCHRQRRRRLSGRRAQDVAAILVVVLAHREFDVATVASVMDSPVERAIMPELPKEAVPVRSEIAPETRLPALMVEGKCCQRT